MTRLLRIMAWSLLGLATFSLALPASTAADPSHQTQGAQMTTDTQHLTPQAQGAQFLEDNLKKPGVQTLPGGLQYQVEIKGEGDAPKLTDTVEVMYEGRLIDGTVFDSSYARQQSATFGVNQVIVGWQTALQHMAPGAKWTLYIPSELAYGAQGVPGAIPPHSVLIFTVELLKVHHTA